MTRVTSLAGRLGLPFVLLSAAACIPLAGTTTSDKDTGAEAMKALVKRLTAAKRLNVTAYEVLVDGERVKSISWTATTEAEKEAVVKHFPASAAPGDPNPISAADSVGIEVFEAAGQEKPSFAIGVVGRRVAVEEKGKTTVYIVPDGELFDELTRLARERYKQK